ncbi:hypothetical protein GCM10027605_46070 [Micromonospora zhanjiangensis]
MWRIRVRPGRADAVVGVWRTVVDRIGALPGNVLHDLLRDADDPYSFTVVTEWVDEAAWRAYRDGPVAACLTDALDALREPPTRADVGADADGQLVLREVLSGAAEFRAPGAAAPSGTAPDGRAGAAAPDGRGRAAAPDGRVRAADADGTAVFVDVEIVVPADRRVEFDRGYPQVAARVAAVPGYRREYLLREPDSDVYHIFAEWADEAAFRRWIGNPAHAREEAGPIAPFLIEFRRRMFHHLPQAEKNPPTRPADGREPGTDKESDVHTTTDVLIVGAGPTGLTVAVELARRGVDCRLIEKQAVPPGQADKAIGIHCRTMEIWADQGIAREAMDAGIWLTGNTVYVNGERIHQMSWELPDLPYGHLGLPQYETERILTERLATLGVRPRRGTELVGFAQDADGVTATVTTAAGETATVRAKYLLGCDGAHSRVRELLGLTFSGGLGRFPQLFMLCDVDVDWDMPDGHLLRFLHETDGRMDGMLVCVPLRGESRYRIATLAPPRFFAQTGGQDAPPGFSEELAEPTLDDLQVALDRLAPPGTRASNLRWSSVFRISHGIVDRYRDGRVFVAGDAAHLHPPAGGQGMNTGIQDAWNLGWKLALAVRGTAASGLLDSYEAERRPEGEEIVGRAVRMAFTDELDRDDLRRQFLQEMGMLLSYPDSPIVGESLSAPDALRDGPRPGDRAPDVGGLRRQGVAHDLRLRDLTHGTRHTLLLYADGTAGAAVLAGLAVLAADVRRQCAGDVDVYLLLGPDAPDPRLLDPPVLRDAAGGFRTGYGAAGSALYLVRPDGHVAFRSRPIDGDALVKHLQLVFGGAR